MQSTNMAGQCSYVGINGSPAQALTYLHSKFFAAELTRIVMITITKEHAATLAQILALALPDTKDLATIKYCFY